MENKEFVMKSTNREDYEILFRKRGNYEYAAYCPQLDYMVKGTEHDEVKNKLAEYISEYVEKIVSENNA